MCWQQHEDEEQEEEEKGEDYEKYIVGHQVQGDACRTLQDVCGKYN